MAVCPWCANTDRHVRLTPGPRAIALLTRLGLSGAQIMEVAAAIEEDSHAPADLFGEPLLGLPVIVLADAFDQFWQHYPRKVGKDTARKAFLGALKRIGGNNPGQVLIDAVIAYTEVADLKDPGFIPHPSTWLNAGRWKDDLEVERRAAAGPRTNAERREAESSDNLRSLHDAALQGRDGSWQP